MKRKIMILGITCILSFQSFVFAEDAVTRDEMINMAVVASGSLKSLEDGLKDTKQGRSDIKNYIQYLSYFMRTDSDYKSYIEMTLQERELYYTELKLQRQIESFDMNFEEGVDALTSNVLYLQDIKASMDDYVKIRYDQYQFDQYKYELGQIAYNDLLSSKDAYDLATLNFDQTRLQLSSLELQLKSLIGLEYNDPLDIVDPYEADFDNELEGVDFYIERAIAGSQAVELAQLEYELTKELSRVNHYFNIDDSRTDIADLNMAIQEQEVLLTDRQVKDAVINAYNDLEYARAAYDMALKAVKNSDLSYHQYELLAEVGRLDTTNLRLIAYENQMKHIDLDNALRTYNVKLYALNRLLK